MNGMDKVKTKKDKKEWDREKERTFVRLIFVIKKNVKSHKYFPKFFLSFMKNNDIGTDGISERIFMMETCSKLAHRPLKTRI